MESRGEFEKARAHYTSALDYLSVVRLACQSGDVDRVSLSSIPYCRSTAPPWRHVFYLDSFEIGNTKQATAAPRRACVVGKTCVLLILVMKGRRLGGFPCAVNPVEISKSKLQGKCVK